MLTKRWYESPWEQSIWVYIANNTQISEHKESSTEIVIVNCHCHCHCQLSTEIDQQVC